LASVFPDDAIVEDPIGPSHFDPEGKGHRGNEKGVFTYRVNDEGKLDRRRQSSMCRS
jgi:hypothetical protein